MLAGSAAEEDPVYQAWLLVSKVSNVLEILVLVAALVVTVVRWRRMGTFAAILSVLGCLAFAVTSTVDAVWVWSDGGWFEMEIETISMLNILSLTANTFGVIALIIAAQLSRGGAPGRQPAELPLAPAGPPYGTAGLPPYAQPHAQAQVQAQPGYGQPAPWTPPQQPGVSD